MHPTSDHSSLLSLGTYELFEAGHPGYKQNVDTIIDGLKSLKRNRQDKRQPFSILEVGAGPGTLLTQRLGQEFADRGDRVLVNEIEESAMAVLKDRTQQYYDTKEQKSLPIVDGQRPILSPHLTMLPAESILDWMERAKANGEKVDAIVSNFTMHHLKPHELDKFFELATHILKPGGKIITGEEHLDYSIASDMLRLLGLDEKQIEDFSLLAKLADQSVSRAALGKGLGAAYQDQREKAMSSLDALGIPKDVTPIELRKHLRPAGMISYHVGRIIDEAWDEGKIKLPGLEFKALASGLSTCGDFFSSMHSDTESPGTSYNRVAIALLDKLTQKLQTRAQEPFVEWESVEHGATQGGLVSEKESREAFIRALAELKTSLTNSKVMGLPNPCSIFDPDIRYEGEVKKGGDFTEISGIDYKVTPMEFAETAARHGMRVGFRSTGAISKDVIKTAHRLSYLNGDGSVHLNEPILGSVGVTFTGRANEIYRAQATR